MPANMKKAGMKYGYGGSKMKRGGSSFPDLTGDGKVTQADILKGRDVFACGGHVGDRIISGKSLRRSYTRKKQT
jgi:hypothetical protein